MKYTVIGAWQGDEAISVGVVEGEHQVAGGDSGYWDEGVWAITVEADSVELAEGFATKEMQETLDPDV